MQSTTAPTITSSAGDLVRDDVDVWIEPTEARVWNTFLSGATSWEVDRAVAAAVSEAWSGCKFFVWQSRTFARRAVTEMYKNYGVCDFLNLGCGHASVGWTHEVVRELSPNARVLHVDKDPVVVAAVNLEIKDDSKADAVNTDLRDVDRVLAAGAALFAPGRPVGVLAAGTLSFMTDSRAIEHAARQYSRQLPDGSVWCVSHAAATEETAHQAADATDAFAESGIDFTVRDRTELAALFPGWKLASDGIQRVRHWRPDPNWPELSCDDTVGYAAMWEKAIACVMSDVQPLEEGTRR